MAKGTSFFFGHVTLNETIGIYWGNWHIVIYKSKTYPNSAPATPTFRQNCHGTICQAPSLRGNVDKPNGFEVPSSLDKNIRIWLEHVEPEARWCKATCLVAA